MMLHALSRADALLPDCMQGYSKAKAMAGIHAETL